MNISTISPYALMSGGLNGRTICANGIYYRRRFGERLLSHVLFTNQTHTQTMSERLCCHENRIADRKLPDEAKRPVDENVFFRTWRSIAMGAPFLTCHT